MTSLATIIGMIPMAMKLGEGAEQYAPMASHHRRTHNIRDFDRVHRSRGVSVGLSQQTPQSAGDPGHGGSLMRIATNLPLIALACACLAAAQTGAPVLLTLQDAEALALKNHPRCRPPNTPWPPKASAWWKAARRIIPTSTVWLRARRRTETGESAPGTFRRRACSTVSATASRSIS